MVNPELVDDLISGGETIKQTLEIKMTATAILGEATFKLHKWNSNNQKLEVETATSDEESQSYAKRQVGTRKGESKLLGVPWDKEKDKIKVSFPISTAEPTKGHPWKIRKNLRSTRSGFTSDPLCDSRFLV